LQRIRNSCCLHAPAKNRLDLLRNLFHDINGNDISSFYMIAS
jgi:hypothetical protein